MTKLEEVLAEEWIADKGHIWEAEGHFGELCDGYVSSDAAGELRAAVAVLGKRALKLALAAERYGSICHDERCPARLGKPHAPDCEWGRIVAEARKLG